MSSLSLATPEKGACIAPLQGYRLRYRRGTLGEEEMDPTGGSREPLIRESALEGNGSCLWLIPSNQPGGSSYAIGITSYAQSGAHSNYFTIPSGTPIPWSVLGCMPYPYFFSEGSPAGTRVFISVGILLEKFSDVFLTREVRINAVIDTLSYCVRVRLSSSAQRTGYGDIESISRLKIIDLIDENSLIKSPDLGIYTSAPSR